MLGVSSILLPKTRANCPFFNNFCVPLQAWDTDGAGRDKGNGELRIENGA